VSRIRTRHDRPGERTGGGLHVETRWRSPTDERTTDGCTAAAHADPGGGSWASSW